MLAAGLDVARLNFSHGTLEEHGRRIEVLRAVAREAGREVAILADLPGPKMRLGELAPEPVEIAAGDPFVLTRRPIVGDATGASTTFPRLPEVVRPGDRLFLDDGLVELEVEGVAGDDVRCRVVIGGALRSRKGLNLPGIDLGLSAFTARDRECLAFALEQGVDLVSQSFVESAADLEAVRTAARELGGPAPFLIAKIERARALDRIDEIVAAADGLMVARGDLGVEVPVEGIAMLQKRLIRKAVEAGKPVITATQMLESMIVSRRPTRAEATDVANAILDGTDAVMLSGESAMGRHPVEAVATLARIAAATEPQRPRPILGERLGGVAPGRAHGVADLFALAVETVIAASAPAAVVVPTRTGSTARAISRLRLPVWIAAPTPSLAVARQLGLSYGVEPMVVDEPIGEWSDFVRGWVTAEGLPGRLALLLRGPSPRHPDANHRLEIVDLANR
jgi:pyruvate kinase